MIRKRKPLVNIERMWSMPSRNTFSIPPLRLFVEHAIEGRPAVCDPFVGLSPFRDRCVSNDLNPEIDADFHMDALTFLKSREAGEFDAMLFDPPYSPRQVSECYKKLDMTVNMETTQASFWSRLKVEIGRTVKCGGVVVTCGWNSGGIGQKYGFEMTNILLVAHGGWHNDTIVTLERKTK